MANYIMIRDGSRSDNGCPGYIKYVNPDGRLAVQIYASTDMDSLGTHYLLDPEQVVAISRPVFQRMLNECSKARKFEEVLDEAAEKPLKNIKSFLPIL